jgi:2-methylcitrate dehydratase PrpD
MQAHIEASPALPLQVCFNNRAALQAVDLARTGLPGPRGSIDGPFGYLPLMEGGYTLDRVRAGIGRTWLVASLAHKPYPAGRATHGAIEGVAVLRERHGFAADDVAEIVVTVPPLTGQLISRPDLPDPLPNYARLCTAFVVAKVLQHGQLDLSHYRHAELADARTNALASLVRVQLDSNPDPNALVPQHLAVRLRDGRELLWTCQSMLASAERPLTQEQHLAKFRRCCAFAERPWSDTETEALIGCVDQLEMLDDVRVLTKMLG